jgi:hypothetical protein
VQAAAAPGALARASGTPGAVPPAFQRSVADGTVAGGRSTYATGLPGGAAYGAHPPVPGADPGAIAIGRGIAHRDSDGSVVFDLSPAPVLSRSVSAPPRHERPTEPAGAISPPDIVQRVGAPAPAGSSDGPAGDVPSPATATASVAETGPPPATIPSLDELARQLFDPLVARLKAELRLDRERAGLLTDMRQ